MNQILNEYEINSNSNKYKKKFNIILSFSLLIIVIGIFAFIFSKYQILEKEKVSKNLISNYSIQTLYNNSTNYETNSTLLSLTSNNPFIIGIIQIDKIDLLYPILSTTTEELLKISPCKFYGPMPNEIGNLCIAGHNYVNNKQFGKVNYLDMNDIIKIFDLNGNYIDYKIYSKTEISATDLSCTNQNTNGAKEITLITCNNIKGNRTCIKAKQ